MAASQAVHLISHCHNCYFSSLLQQTFSLIVVEQFALLLLLTCTVCEETNLFCRPQKIWQKCVKVPDTLVGKGKDFNFVTGFRSELFVNIRGLFKDTKEGVVKRKTFVRIAVVLQPYGDDDDGQRGAL